MNIFFLSLDPTECAQLYCDQHVIKILLEITQMLYTAWHMSDKPDDWKPPLTQSGNSGYKKAHPGHPMCMWVRSSRKSYMFAVKLGMALALEYNNRFQKCHACTKHILWLHSHVPPTFDPKRSQTAYYGKYGVPQCMPKEHHQPDLVLAYRSYYTTKTFARFSSAKRNETHIGMELLKQGEVVQWVHGDFSFLEEKTKAHEDAWGQGVMKALRPDLKLDKQWTNRFGEYLCQEVFTHVLGKTVTKPIKKLNYQPDLETDDEIIEVKTGTYFTTGTAGEKILGCPFKYADIPELYGKPLKIVCIGGAEKMCREVYGNLPGEKCTPQKQKFLDFFRDNRVEFVGLTSICVALKKNV
jgi:hypothetical protein